MRPRFRPALLQAAELLVSAGRRDEAVALLEEALPHVQSPAAPARCYGLLRESGEPARLLALLDRVEALSPIREPAIDAWLAAARCHVHARRGDHAAAAREAARVGTEHHRRLAERLSSPDPGWRRVRLPVPFVGAGPPDLRPGHARGALGVRREAGPAGRDHRGDLLRRDPGARRAGLVRAAGLRRAGVPRDVGGRAPPDRRVDALRHRDPLRRRRATSSRSSATTTRAGRSCSRSRAASRPWRSTRTSSSTTQRLSGPRGLAFVPEGERERLHSMDLPDAALQDLRDAAEAALHRFDRAGAEAAIRALDATAPGHALGWLVRLAVARFDDDEVETRRVVEALLAMLPNDPRLVAWNLRSLRITGRREERIALLVGAVDAGVEAAAFRRELAVEWMTDARTWPQARRLLASSHVLSPRESRTLVLLADLEERSDAPGRGLELRRFATALEDTDECAGRRLRAGRGGPRGGRTRRWAGSAAGSRRTARSRAPRRSRWRTPSPATRAPPRRSRCCGRPCASARRTEPSSSSSRRRRRGRARSRQARAHLDAARAGTRPGVWWRAEARCGGDRATWRVRSRHGDGSSSGSRSRSTRTAASRGPSPPSNDRRRRSRTWRAPSPASRTTSGSRRRCSGGWRTAIRRGRRRSSGT